MNVWVWIGGVAGGWVCGVVVFGVLGFGFGWGWWFGWGVLLFVFDGVWFVGCYFVVVVGEFVLLCSGFVFVWLVDCEVCCLRFVSL